VKRTEPPLFLPRSPLVFTLGLVQFDPVLAIGDYVAAIQEALRKRGFPKVRQRMVPHRIMQTEGRELQAEFKKQWEFHDSENRTSIMVDYETVFVQTTDYTTFEDFRENLELALQSVADLLEINEVIRCGLRYIDIVDVPDAGDIAKWVRPGLLGLAGMAGFERRQSHSSTELRGKEDSTLVVKATLVPRGIILPPDLVPCDLAFARQPVRDKPFVLLDLDHFSHRSFRYDRNATLEHLSTLHDGLDHAFRTSVTPEALEQWKKKQ